MSSQIVAMGVQVFEVGLFKPSADEQGQAVMIPRTWDAATLLRSVPWLRLQNSYGRNVYIRPKGEHNLSLIDDLSRDSLQRMRAAGFQPTLVTETSPGNFQAWLKHPRRLPTNLSTAVARALAERFDGDIGAADWRHFGRLAGFTNRKEKYQGANGLFPYVRLIEASGAEYQEGQQFVRDVEHQLQLREHSNVEQRRLNSPSLSGTLRSIERFRENGVYAGDGNRIDLAYSIYALSHGATTGDVAAAIRSRDLSHKGPEKRQNEYVERTIRKALSVIDRQTQPLQR